MSEFDLLNVKAEPSEDLITPDNSVFLFIDHQPQMFFGVGSDDRQSIINAAVGLAKASEAFNVPAVITTVAAESFSGHLLPALREVFPDAKVIDRTTMNSWEDERVVDAVKATGRRKILGQEVLDTEHFPTIDFVSDPPLRTAGPDTYDLDGRLTLRGVTRTVALSLRFNGVTTDIWGKSRLGLTAQATLLRDDFGAGNFGRVTLPLGEIMVPPAVPVTLDIEATKDDEE